MIYHFIVNPRARSGLGEMLWKQLEPELCRKKNRLSDSSDNKEKRMQERLHQRLRKMARSTCLLFLEATVHSMKY